MNVPVFENLDLVCAQAAKTIVDQSSQKKELEKLLTSALAVLEAQGVYAMALFLKAKGSKIGEDLIQKLREFLKNTPQQAPLLSDDADVFTSLQHMAKDLDKLLLTRDLIRQTLVYARYYARALQGSKE